MFVPFWNVQLRYLQLPTTYINQGSAVVNGLRSQISCGFLNVHHCITMYISLFSKRLLYVPPNTYLRFYTLSLWLYILPMNFSAKHLLLDVSLDDNSNTSLSSYYLQRHRLRMQPRYTQPIRWLCETAWQEKRPKISSAHTVHGWRNSSIFHLTLVMAIFLI